MKIHFTKKQYILLIILTLTTAAIFVFISIFNKPAVGEIKNIVDQPQTVKPAKLNELVSKYFTSKYPDRYQLQANQNPSASLESWVLIAHQASEQLSSAKIAVTISKLPAGGAKEDSAYKQFEANPSIYKLSNANYGNEEQILATRNETNFEKTVLWAHKDYLLTISMTSGTRTDILESEIEVLLKNLVWTI